MGEKRKTCDNVFLRCGGHTQTRSNDNDMLVLTRHFYPDLSLASQTMLQSIAEREIEHIWFQSEKEVDVG